MQARGGWGRGGSGATLFAFAALLMLAPPARPQSPPRSVATNAFDGIYAGVSAVNNSRGNSLRGSERSGGYAGARACRDFRQPARLTITGGQAQVKWGQYVLRGSVTPQGGLVMTTGYGHHFEGQIQTQDTVTGQLVGYCTYTLTWRKTG